MTMPRALIKEIKENPNLLTNLQKKRSECMQEALNKEKVDIEKLKQRLKSVRGGNDNGDKKDNDADWNLCKDIQTEAEYWRRQRTALVASIVKDKCLSSDQHEDLKTKATINTIMNAYGARHRNTDYSDNEDVHTFIRRAAILPLIPKPSIGDVWFNALESIDEAVNVPDTSRFASYVTTQWVEGDRALWNHYDTQGPRTTNQLEGWHSKTDKQIHKFVVAQLQEQLKNVEDMSTTSADTTREHFIKMRELLAYRLLPRLYQLWSCEGDHTPVRIGYERACFRWSWMVATDKRCLHFDWATENSEIGRNFHHFFCGDNTTNLPKDGTSLNGYNVIAPAIVDNKNQEMCKGRMQLKIIESDYDRNNSTKTTLGENSDAYLSIEKVISPDHENMKTNGQKNKSGDDTQERSEHSTSQQRDGQLTTERNISNSMDDRSSADSVRQLSPQLSSPIDKSSASGSSYGSSSPQPDSKTTSQEKFTEVKRGTAEIAKKAAKKKEEAKKSGHESGAYKSNNIQGLDDITQKAQMTAQKPTRQKGGAKMNHIGTTKTKKEKAGVHMPNTGEDSGQLKTQVEEKPSIRKTVAKGTKHSPKIADNSKMAGAKETELSGVKGTRLPLKTKKK